MDVAPDDFVQFDLMWLKIYSTRLSSQDLKAPENMIGDDVPALGSEALV